METTFSQMSSYVLIGVSLVLASIFYFLKLKATKKSLYLTDKITSLEFSNASLSSQLEQERLREKKNSSSPEMSLQQNPNSELLELRKERSQLKDELKKAKDEIAKSRFSKDEIETSVNNKLFSLQSENTRIIEQLKELDSENKTLKENFNSVVPVSVYEQKISDLSEAKNELSGCRTKIVEIEKQHKQNISKIISLQGKLKIAEQEIRKWNDFAQVEEGKTVDPGIFLRWKERALVGRKMYQLMRQTRELSDEKLKTYQDGIIAVSKWVLTQKNLNVPRASKGEHRADKLLGEAWNAILDEDAQKKINRSTQKEVKLEDHESNITISSISEEVSAVKAINPN